MAFYSDDLYSVSSGAYLYDYWNPFVTKFDSSSFYSWEQDNIPLYDLEERTDYLWEKLGWPTSSIPGLVLAVSSDIPTHLDASTNVFTTIDDAIDALPEIIRFPTLIEVAVSGDLGDIKLDNIKCVGNGVLEIINRVHGTLYESGDVVGNPGTKGNCTFRSTYAAGNFATQVRDTSCLLLSSNTSSLYYSDTGMSMHAAEFNNTELTPYTNVCLGNGTYKLTTTASLAQFVAADVTIGTSPFNDTTTDNSAEYPDGTLVTTDAGRTTLASSDNVIGIYTGNRISGIKVSNCDGPIYIRGFLVNAASGTAGTYEILNDYGIDINSCEGLVIENCGVARAGVAGLRVNNSDVTLNRRFFSARNYDIDNRGVADDYGILAYNSVINFGQDTYAQSTDSMICVGMQKYGIKLTNSILKGGEAVNAAQSTGSVVNVNHCDTAYHLTNSTLSVLGFLDAYNNTRGYDLYESTLETDNIIAHAHTKEGLRLNGSTLLYNKQLVLPTTFPDAQINGQAYKLSKNFYSNNGQHIVARESLIKPEYADEMPDKHGEFSLLFAFGNNSIDDSPLAGVELINSDAELISAFSTRSDANVFPARGKHLLLQRSSSCVLRGHENGATIIHEYHAENVGSNIHLTGNSTINISGPTSITDMDAAIVCDDNSTLSITPHLLTGKGTLDVSGYKLNKPENHTSVYVNGIGGCLVANNNSTIDMKDLGSFEACWSGTLASDPVFSAIDSRGYGDNHQYFSAGSFTFLPHTGIGTPDRQASRGHGGAGSVFYWYNTPPRRFTTTPLDNGVHFSYLERDPVSMSIEDWRNYSNGGICVKATNNSTVNVDNVNFMPGPVVADGIFLDPYLEQAGGCNDLRVWSIAGGSTLHSSHLSVSGLYPSQAGHYGPRGVYYDGSSYDCSDAAYTAFNDDPYVSGQRFVKNLPQWRNFTPNTGSYPDLAGLDAVSGLGYYEDMPLGNLAILDFFGLGCSSCSSLSSVENTLENEYFQSWSRKRFGSDNSLGFGTSANYENWGIFRLYMEVDPVSKSLSYSGADPSSYDNRPFQTLAQGYFLSGPCSATSGAMDSFAFGLHSVTPSAYEIDGSGVIVSGFIPSGYYHPARFCTPERYNILLDDSASNTFSNAKNASIPILGRPKLVNIYRATTEEGGSASLATSGFGAGFKMHNIFDFNKDI